MWQTKLGRCIYKSPSGYKVHQNVLYRWLTLNSKALQTVIKRRNPQKPILYYLPTLTLMANQYPGSTCLLGLGGAGVPLILASKESAPPLVAVDISKEVIDIATRFFMIEDLHNFTIVHKNAMDYVKNTKDHYSHVLIDLYNANHFPLECTNELFFSSCKKILAEHGFLALNVANPKEQKPIFKLVKEHFSQTLVIPIKKTTNIVIFASNGMNRQEFISKIEAARHLKRIAWVESWDYVGDFE